jgi:hypothetical protein
VTLRQSIELCTSCNGTGERDWLTAARCSACGGRGMLVRPVVDEPLLDAPPLVPAAGGLTAAPAEPVCASASEAQSEATFSGPSGEPASAA